MTKPTADPSVMYFSPLKLRPFLLISHSAGLDVPRLLAAHGTSEREMTDPETRLPRLQCVAIIRGLLAQLNDPLAGLRAAERAQLADVDVLGYFAQHCATALDAMQQALRFSRLVGDASEVAIVRNGNEVSVSVGLSGGRSSIPELADFAVASGHVGLCTLTGGKARALRVELARPTPSDPSAYRRFFGAPVTFGARRGLMVYAAAELLEPLPNSDARLAQLLAEHAEARLRGLPEISSLVQQVRSQLRNQIDAGVPTLTSVAAKLKLSERTLRRRLQTGAGTTFRQLLDEVRHERALQLLRAGELNVNDIAHRLGFSDATAFGRAFRRWTGTSPTKVTDVSPT